MRRVVLIACTGMMLVATVTEAQVPANTARGERLASQLCAACHAVGRAPTRQMSTDVPSFRTIAKRKVMNAETIAGRIIIPHPAMPGIALTADEIRDLAGYIMSLAAEAR